jgi:hypothetical protein
MNIYQRTSMKKMAVRLFCIYILFPLFNTATAQVNPIKIPELDSVVNGYDLSRVDTLGKSYLRIAKAAEFRGGNMGWITYLEKNLQTDLGTRYVKMKRSDSIARQSVVVNFLVNATGIISDVSADKTDTHPKLVEEAIRVVRDGPRWEPARMDLFEIIQGKIPLQQIKEKNKTGFTRVIYRHKQSITFVVTKE